MEDISSLPNERLLHSFTSSSCLNGEEITACFCCLRFIWTVHLTDRRIAIRVVKKLFGLSFHEREESFRYKDLKHVSVARNVTYLKFFYSLLSLSSSLVIEDAIPFLSGAGGGAISFLGGVGSVVSVFFHSDSNSIEEEEASSISSFSYYDNTSIWHETRYDETVFYDPFPGGDADETVFYDPFPGGDADETVFYDPFPGGDADETGYYGPSFGGDADETGYYDPSFGGDADETGYYGPSFGGDAEDVFESLNGLSDSFDRAIKTTVLIGIIVLVVLGLILFVIAFVESFCFRSLTLDFYKKERVESWLFTVFDGRFGSATTRALRFSPQQCHAIAKALLEHSKTQLLDDSLRSSRPPTAE